MTRSRSGQVNNRVLNKITWTACDIHPLPLRQLPNHLWGLTRNKFCCGHPTDAKRKNSSSSVSSRVNKWIQELVDGFLVSCRYQTESFSFSFAEKLKLSGYRACILITQNPFWWHSTVNRYYLWTFRAQELVAWSWYQYIVFGELWVTFLGKQCPAQICWDNSPKPESIAGKGKKSSRILQMTWFVSHRNLSLPGLQDAEGGFPCDKIPAG